MEVASGAPSALLWALESLPEDLWARGVVCPAERAVMLAATSKRVRTLLARLQRRVPATLRMVGIPDMGKRVVGSANVFNWLFKLQQWCQVVRLDLHKLQRGGGIMMGGVPISFTSDDRPIGSIGAGLLTIALCQCSSLVALNLRANDIGDDGVGCLAGAAGCLARVVSSFPARLNLLGQCSSLVALDLGFNHIGADGIGRLAGALGQCSSLTELNLDGNAIGDEGAERLAGVLEQCSSLVTLCLAANAIGDEGAGHLAWVLGECPSLSWLFLYGNRIGQEGSAMLRSSIRNTTKLRI